MGFVGATGGREISRRMVSERASQRAFFGVSRISSSSTSVRGGGGAASWRICRRVSTLMSQKTEKLTIRNWITALRKTPKFKVTAPAFWASASVASEGPFSVTKMLVKSMPPMRSPMIGVKMSFTKAVHHGGESNSDDNAYGEVHIAAHDERAELVDPGRPSNNNR